jgi:hypothetical protein
MAFHPTAFHPIRAEVPVGRPQDLIDADELEKPELEKPA